MPMKLEFELFILAFGFDEPDVALAIAFIVEGGGGVAETFDELLLLAAVVDASEFEMDGTIEIACASAEIVDIFN
jgi:hypothetical protein